MTYRETENLFFSELNDIYPEYETGAIIQIVFAQIFKLTRFEIHQKAKDTVPLELESQIYNIIRQLKQYKPLQYILGVTEFYGLPFIVNESVLIPRPETEELVQWIINDCKDNKAPSILDIGTGSGCIAVSLAKNIPESKVSGIDISNKAIETAYKNALLNNLEINFIQCDILNYEPDKFGLFDIIVSNPPYIDREQELLMQPNVLQYEPHIALFAPDNKPLQFYETIALFAFDKLSHGGLLYFEINEKYPDETSKLIRNIGFSTELKQDINNKYRMLKAWKNG